MSAEPWAEQTRPRHGAGTWGGIADLFVDRGGHTKQVTMWQSPASDPIEMAEWRARVKLERAQTALGEAVRHADRPLPCREPGPNLWLSEEPWERLEAAERCRAACPVIDACGAVGEAAPLDTWGVYGGTDYAAEVGDVDQLRRLAAAASRGRAGSPVMVKRNKLLLRLAADGISPARLAEVSGLSIHTVRAVLENRRGGLHDQAQQRAYAEKRRARNEAEVADRDGDPRLKRLRELAAHGEKLRNPRLTAERAELVASLRADNPKFWTNERLAIAAGLRTSAQVTRILRRASAWPPVSGGKVPESTEGPEVATPDPRQC